MEAENAPTSSALQSLATTPIPAEFIPLTIAASKLTCVGLAQWGTIVEGWESDTPPDPDCEQPRSLAACYPPMK